MRCCSVRLLLVAMLATHHTDFESYVGGCECESLLCVKWYVMVSCELFASCGLTFFVRRP